MGKEEGRTWERPKTVGARVESRSQRKKKRPEGKVPGRAQAVLWGLNGAGDEAAGEEEAVEASSGRWQDCPRGHWLPKAGHSGTCYETRRWRVSCSISVHNQRLETI